MKIFPASGLACALLLFHLGGAAVSDGSKSDGALFGFRDASQELKAETEFLAVPDPKLAEEHLRILTQAPHIAGSPEDKATADYVASKFRQAGLDTEIVEYRVWFNYPAELSVDATASTSTVIPFRTTLASFRPTTACRLPAM
jgi:N-acetylated-alpha-linked acidic dipeptidase